MGSFNSSGFISKLPIRYGDRVVCLIATENPYASIRNLFIPDCRLVPWGIPVRGKYNDYGSIEDIDEDYNTDFLRRLFKTDNVNDIFDAIDRCMYGETLDDNIKYWKHDKEEVKKYKMLLPMYGNIKNYLKFINSGIDRKYKTQPLCTLMFEHEEVYNFVTANEVDDGWHNVHFEDALDNHITLISIETEMQQLIDEYYGEQDRNRRDPKTFFERKHDDYDPFDFFVNYSLEKDQNDMNAGKEELIARIKAKYEEYKSNAEADTVYWGAEGRSPMFMMQFALMKPETYLRFISEKRDEIIRFCRMMRYMAAAPMIFECSVTAGQQHMNARGFIEFYDFLHRFADRYFMDYLADCDEEEYLDSI